MKLFLPLAATLSLGAATSMLPKTCCASLANTIPGKVFSPNETTYEDRMGSFWSISAAVRPWCLVLPATAKDVSLALTTLVAHNCMFGVRSGGHGSFALSNSVQNGVTIDFGYMNATIYDENTKTASIGPGSPWQAVYETLDPHGVTVAGGRAGSVGVGGFLTGGGNSFFSASHGLGCDSVVGFEVVLADGSVVYASADNYRDLWIALKGGSANLGLVTRFDVRVIDFPDPAHPDIWAHSITFDPEDTGDVLDALANFTAHAHVDRNTTAISYVGHVPELGGTVFQIGLENTRGVADPPAADQLRTAGRNLSNFTAVLPLAELVRSENPAQASGYRNVWFTLSFANDARIMKRAVELHGDAVEELKRLPCLRGTNGSAAADNFISMCSFQPLNHVVGEYSDNVVGLSRWTQGGHDGILFLAEVGFHSRKGDEAKADSAVSAIVDKWVAGVEAYARELDAAWDWQYLNYAGGHQDPLASIGPEALDTLRGAAATYDPQGVFQRLRGSGFKIPGAEAD